MDNSLNNRYQQQLQQQKEHASLRRSNGQEPVNQRPNYNSHSNNKRVERDDELEEDEYERRREEEINRQIKNKEAEIHKLAKASEHLRSKLDQQITTTQRQQFHQQQQQQQQDPSKYHSFGSQQVPQRDVSPSSALYSAQQEFVPPAHVREHVSNLQSDNASLMRRLNLVLQELERVSREKDDIQSRLQQYSKESMNLQRMINGEDNVDKVNKHMNEDLRYERDRNSKLSQQIKESDDYKNDLLRELRKVDDSQESQDIQRQNMGAELQKRINQIIDIEKEVYFVEEKIKINQVEIEQTKRDDMLEKIDKADLQRVINQLHAERNDLLAKLDNLTQKYDECVREISRDRQEMERHNKQHSKLVTAKVLFSELEICLKKQYKTAFQEVKIYCQFDNKCHKKLQKFAKVLNVIGRYKQQISLQKWYQSVLKPLQQKSQSRQLSLQIANQNLKSKVLHIWINKCQKRINSYDQKNQAVQLIWEIKKNDSKVEVKRGFQIWKEINQEEKRKKNKIQKLIYKLYFNKLKLSLTTWQNHSSNVAQQVRLNLLSSNFTKKQYLNLLYQNFRYQSFDQKRKRLNTLFHTLKYWKDYLNYKKFLMGAQVQVLQMQEQINTNIVKQCFDAMRINKEEEKFQRVDYQLNQVELPTIQSLSVNMTDNSAERNLKLAKKAADCFVNLANKGMNSYFQKWKKIYQDFKDVPQTKLKGRITKAYYDKIRMAFNRWKVIGQQIQTQQNELVILEQQEMQTQLQEDVLSIQKEIKDKRDMQDQSQQKHVNKCILSLQNRLLRQAVGRWKDKMAEVNIKEDGANTIIKRLRTRILRQAFDLYKAGSQYQRKVEIDESRCQQYKKTRDQRVINLVFNQWKIYKQNFAKSKSYWYRIYMRMDRILAERGFKRWRESVKIMKEEGLQQAERQVINEITELNHQIGEVTSTEEAQQQLIKQTRGQLTKQAQRILANTFAKYYYIGQTRGLEKWKEYVQYEKKKQTLLKRMVDHWRRYQFNYVRSSLKNWMIFADIDTRKDQIKKEEMKIKDTDFSLDLQRKTNMQSSNKLTAELNEINRLQNMYNSRLQKSIQMIVKKVDQNDYMSQKRYILVQWRNYVKRELFFINCIKKVVNKSMWTEGFKKIREHSRKDQQQQKMEEVLNRFRQKFWKRTCNNAFSVWRSGQFSTVFQQVEETITQTNQRVQDHQERVVVRREVNAVKAGRTIGSQNMRNLFAAWKNVIKHLKLQRNKSDHYSNALEVFRKKAAVRKWRMRQQKTQISRIRLSKLKAKFQRMRKQLVFSALHQRFVSSKDLSSRISNLASILDLQCIQSGFNAILSFSRSKNYVHQTQKQHSIFEITMLLNRIVIKKKHQYMNELKYKTIDSKKQQLYKTLTIMHNCNNKMRFLFMRWKLNGEVKALKEEMENEGPIREQIFEERIKLKNCQNLLQEEGYSAQDVNSALQIGTSHHKSLLLKSIRRLQHFNTDLYLKPKFFDQWRQFVFLRKLFRYYLQFTERRSEYIKSDIAVAFDRWKRFDIVQKQVLSKLSKKELDMRVGKNSSKLGGIADLIEEKENIIEHKSVQRDELVENYIKGQKLALVMWVNNQNQAKHQAISIWKQYVDTMKTSISNQKLRQDVELIAILKEKIRKLEHENSYMSSENEELRQFSLDGYEIAKNVQALSGEREKLSVDLADKAQTIRKLLDENDKLNKSLRFAQEEAHSLIKSTNKGMGSNKFGNNSGSGKGGFQQSPMVRNNVY